MKTALELTREDLLEMLQAFARQRPGIEPRDYASWRDYRNESARVTRDLADFRVLLSAVSWRGIDAAAIRAALQDGRRLTLSDDGRLDYCTGQYFPTEYRRAACSVLASLLWGYTRESMTKRTGAGVVAYPSGDALRAALRREFGRRIASRYFN